jgi:nucleotide-binding universal stress UspA family protein
VLTRWISEVDVMDSTVKDRVVVGVDGSPSSDDALRWAAREADLHGDVLEVVCCWTYPATVTMAPFQPSLRDQVFADGARHVVKDSIERVLGGSADHMDVVAEVVEGPPSQRLVELSQDAAMVVVGCSGRGGFAGLLLGSVSQHLAEHGHCPVVVVHGEPGKERSP